MSALKVNTVLSYLQTACDHIETGEPWYEPRAYALAAIKDCEDALAAVRKEGLNDFTVELARLTISAASQCTRTDREEEMLTSDVADKGRLWQEKEVQT